ncbi:MAG: DUF5329 domain-containing protein [Gammaproteobacteria bacterium]|nr:DUF5329 domain-containing protein [Gammaproteobacteria bacterium]
MKHTRCLAIALLFAGHVTTTSADVPTEQRHEVEHLLNFIANTSCIIDRNGSLHNGPEALAHIKKKYAYFRNDISSTEQFIELSASQSTFSGKAYTVRCEDTAVVTTREWLLTELVKYRHQETASVD